MLAMLAAVEATPDPEAQRGALTALQRAFVTKAPAIPLFPNPAWGEYNSKRFTNWPDADDPYAPLTPNGAADSLILMTTVRPVTP